MNVRVVAGLVAVQVFFALNYVAAKVALAEIPPRAWALIRVVGASVLLYAAIRATGRRLPTDLRTLRSLAFLSLFAVVLNQICFIEGLDRTTPTHSALMNSTIPVLTLLFAVLLGDERVRARKLAALAVASVGVLLVIRPWRPEGLAGTVTGDVLTLVNAASFSFFLAASKRTFQRTDPLAATTVMMAIGSLGVAVVGLPPLLALDHAAVSATAWGLAAFVVVFPTAGAYLITSWALARVESSRVAFFIYLQPVLAATLSWWIVGERFGTPLIAGAALIFAGVWLATRRSAQSSSASLASSSAPRGSTDSSMSNAGE